MSYFVIILCSQCTSLPALSPLARAAAAAARSDPAAGHVRCGLAYASGARRGLAECVARALIGCVRCDERWGGDEGLAVRSSVSLG